MTTLFISDLHLQPSQPELLRASLHWLATATRDADALYILGDLFEAWIGDDDDSPWLDEFATVLRRLADQGTCLYFMHGNRDFLLGDKFARRCGVELLPEATVIDLYGRKTLLMHGDTLCTEDRDYLAFRTQVRNPQWQQAILSRPLDERRALAAMLREKSKMAGSNKAEDIMDVTPDEVTRVMRDNAVDLLIHGHTHRPARHSLIVSDNSAERIVLGDWSMERGGWVIRAEADGRIALENFPLQ